VDVARGQLVGRRLEAVTIVMDLDEIGPVVWRPASGRDRRRLERLTEVCQDIPERSKLGDK
jgi:hypothetical protein